MLQIGTRAKGQPAPDWVLFESSSQPQRPEGRSWLQLLHDEHAPEILEAREAVLVVWGSIWTRRPDARVRFDITDDGHGSAGLRWTLLVEEPDPGPALTGHLCKRLNQLVNAELRYSYG